MAHAHAAAFHANPSTGPTAAAAGTAAPPPLVEAATIAPVRFVMAAPIAAFAPRSASAAPGVDRVPEPATGAPFEEHEVTSPARLVARAPVVYPPEARAQQIETDVRVEIVVDATGRVVAARSLSNAGYDLDAEAVRAVRQYRFSPATRDGRAVSVRMRWTVQFRLE